MSPSRFRECLAALDWSQRGLARLLDRAEGTVREWARGRLPVPAEVAEWLEARASSAEQLPPPARRGRAMLEAAD